MADGTNGNGTPTWVKTLITATQQLGLPTVFCGVLLWMVVTLWVTPMTDHQDKLINANIESQVKLTSSVDKMAARIEEGRIFEALVQQTHVEQSITLENIKGVMEDAGKQMATIPAKRDETNKLLIEIRDQLNEGG